MTSRRRVALLLVLVAAIAAAALLWVRSAQQKPVTVQPIGWSSLPRKVTAEVLNAGGVSGAARGGALLLRHAGVDVVLWTTDTGHGAIDRTQILVRRGDTTGVGRISEALGHTPLVLDSADGNRLVDLTVKLGRDYAPPPDRIKANQ